MKERSSLVFISNTDERNCITLATQDMSLKKWTVPNSHFAGGLAGD